MKQKKKVTLVAIAATLVLGVSAFAASGIAASWSGWSYSKPDYTTLPTVSEVEEAIGYDVVLLDTFENGYAFENGSIVNNQIKDEAGNVIEQFRSVTFRYEKEGDEVIFEQQRFHTESKQEGEQIGTVKDIPLYYVHYTNKLVPPDYQMTAEDRAAQESGELVFSWGSDEVQLNEVQSVQWCEDGVQCLLMQIDGTLSAEQLAEMAAEAMES